MRDKRLDITLPMEQAKRVIESPNQLVMITGEDGEWTGVTINKAEIKGTDHDFEREREENRQDFLRIDEPEITPEQILRANEIKRQITEKLKFK